MSAELTESVNNALKEKNSKLKSIYPGFKCVAGKLKDAGLSPEFWKKESENILKFVAEGRKMKESMRMSSEKFRQEFTI